MAPHLCSLCSNPIGDRESLLIQDSDHDLHVTTLTNLRGRIPSGRVVVWHSGCPTTYTPPSRMIRDLASGL